MWEVAVVAEDGGIYSRHHGAMGVGGERRASHRGVWVVKVVVKPYLQGLGRLLRELPLLLPLQQRLLHVLGRCPVGIRGERATQSSGRMSHGAQTARGRHGGDRGMREA